MMLFITIWLMKVLRPCTRMISPGLQGWIPGIDYSSHLVSDPAVCLSPSLIQSPHMQTVSLED